METMILALGVVIAAVIFYFVAFYNGGQVLTQIQGALGLNSGSQANQTPAGGPETLTAMDAVAAPQSAMEAGSTPYASMSDQLPTTPVGAESPYASLTARGPAPISSPSINPQSVKIAGMVAAPAVAPSGTLGLSAVQAPNVAPTVSESPFAPPISQIKTLGPVSAAGALT